MAKDRLDTAMTWLDRLKTFGEGVTPGKTIFYGYRKLYKGPYTRGDDYTVVSLGLRSG